ncbi:MAG: hypothetical protein JSV13_03785 [Nitrospiraceae bacterium]|nr:MAG: hypothetical protein JSV13_03785 [Nitrospiraceae bacterium]
MKKIVFVILIVLLVMSCGKKEAVKKISHESQLAQESFALAETVRQAFEKGDLGIIKINSTEAGYADITSNERAYDRVGLVFTPRWVEIEDENVSLNIAWKGTWTADDMIAQESGMAIFLMEGTPLKVTKILRANPFVFPK